MRRAKGDRAGVLRGRRMARHRATFIGVVIEHLFDARDELIGEVEGWLLRNEDATSGDGKGGIGQWIA